jgi:NAD-dependent deacetylase
MNVNADIHRAAELIHASRHAVAFTGAGHSTPSGIPDFRSPDSGLWEKANPMLVASIWSFRLQPQRFYEWVRPLVRLTLGAQPNPAHQALAELEQMGKLQAVITQNIDNLHQRAGSRRVLALHGDMEQATCIRCYKVVPAGPMIDQFMEDGVVPRCSCGGVMKPNVILFGEQLPVRVLNEAYKEVRRADLMIVAGSSLEVRPAADLPFLALESGARLVVVNLSATPADAHADVVLHADVADALPCIVEALRELETATHQA